MLLRSKYPSRSLVIIAQMLFLARNSMPLTLTWIVHFYISPILPFVVPVGSTWPTCAHLYFYSCLSHGPCAFSPSKSTIVITCFNFKSTFWEFYQSLGEFKLQFLIVFNAYFKGLQTFRPILYIFSNFLDINFVHMLRLVCKFISLSNSRL